MRRSSSSSSWSMIMTTDCGTPSAAQTSRPGMIYIQARMNLNASVTPDKWVAVLSMEHGQARVKQGEERKSETRAY